MNASAEPGKSGSLLVQTNIKAALVHERCGGAATETGANDCDAKRISQNNPLNDVVVRNIMMYTLYFAF